jgi:hypothetical protein
LAGVVSAQVWVAATQAQTLMQAHEAVVQLRPVPDAPRAEWVSFRVQAAQVYWRVAEVDPGHQWHARYWANRESAYAEELRSFPDTMDPPASTRHHGRRHATAGETSMPATLQQAHEVLGEARPSTDAGFHRMSSMVTSRTPPVCLAGH